MQSNVQTSKPESNPLRILFILFPEFNTLDFAGPFETLSHTATGDAFQRTIAANKHTTHTAEGAELVRDITFEAALDRVRKGDVDILIVPGGLSDGVMKEANGQNGEEEKLFLKIITEFAALEGHGRDGKERVLMSICTGALFLGSLGLLKGLEATTHHLSLDTLREVCAKQGGKPTTVVKARWVDAGLNDHGVRIITSGGISSGLDASLHLVQLKEGAAAEEFAADIIEHDMNPGIVAGVQP